MNRADENKQTSKQKEIYKGESGTFGESGMFC